MCQLAGSKPLGISSFICEPRNVEKQLSHNRELLPRVHKNGEVQIIGGAGHSVAEHVIEQQISSGGTYQHVVYLRVAKEPIDEFQDAER